jgi:nucleoid DNA-binding protein
MTKTELIAAVAYGEGISKVSAGRIINDTLRLIAESCLNEGRCELAGFGVFKKFRSAARSRPSIQDRTKIIHTPARNTVKFKPAKALKAAVN